MRSFEILSVSMLFGLGLSACSGSGTSAGSSQEFITKYCDLLSPCCAKAGLPTMGAQCRTLFTAFGGAAGTYDSSAGSACLSAL